LAASTTYNTLPASFVDAILNGVFKYWPYFLVVESGSFTESYISGGGGGSIAATPTFLSAERNATNL